MVLIKTAYHLGQLKVEIANVITRQRSSNLEITKKEFPVSLFTLSYLVLI